MIALFKTLIVALALLIAVNAQCSGDTPVNGTPAFACSNNAWYTSGSAQISGGSQTWESFVFVSGNMVMDNGAVVIANRNVSVSGRVDIMNNAAFHVGVNGHLQVGAALMLSSGGQLHFYASNTYSYNVTQCIDAAGGVFHVWGVTNGMAIFFPTNCIITYPGSIVAHTVDPCVAATITYTATGVNTVYSSTGAQGCPANVNPPANPPANQPNNPPANTPGTTNAPAKQSNPPGSVPNPDNGGVSPKEVSAGLVALSFLLIAARNL